MYAIPYQYICRVCQENIALMSALDEKTHEMKKMHAEKMGE